MSLDSNPTDAAVPVHTAAAAAAAATSTYSHPRTIMRPDEADRKATHYKNPEYKQSIDLRSAALKEHLLAVHTGITGVCTEYNIQCNAQDLQWLLDHGGIYQSYIPPGCNDWL